MTERAEDERKEAKPPAAARSEWVKPKLEKLSMRSAETTNNVFRVNDAATNYS